jgi:serine/threonine protein kinase
MNYGLALAFARGLAGVLAHLEQADVRVCHMSLGMDAVSIARDGRLVLGGFGYAVQLDNDGATVLRKGQLAGANGLYMAPEVVNAQRKLAQLPEGGEASVGLARANTWSLGCLLYTLVTGQSPWPEWPYEIAAEGDVVYGADAVPDLLLETPPEAGMSKGLAELVQSMMACDPAHRPDAYHRLHVGAAVGRI